MTLTVENVSLNKWDLQAVQDPDEFWTDCNTPSPSVCFHLRLKEIDMSEYDAATYERFSNAVRRQVQSLRIILDSLQVGSTLPHFIYDSHCCSSANNVFIIQSHEVKVSGNI